MKRYIACGLWYTGANVDNASVSIRVPQGAAFAPGAQRLLFLADIHHSWMFPERSLRALFAEIEALSPDMILWGGDYAETPADQRRFFSMVRCLRPRLGMFGVPGNNDLRCFDMDYAALKDAMRSGGIHPLINETAQVALPLLGGGSVRLRLTGLDDAMYGAPDARALLPGQDAGLHVLLSHSPYPLWRMLPRAAAPPDIALCGHTHGGQIALGPLNPYRLGYQRRLSRRPRPIPFRGWHLLRGTRVLISNGIGESLLPIRLGAPPELHCLTLAPCYAPVKGADAY